MSAALDAQIRAAAPYAMMGDAVIAALPAWRARLDNTTNWSIVTMGIALSTTFSSPGASPLPLLLVGLLLAVFLGMEARRYRYFNVWRARARWLEMNFYAPMLTGEARDDSWQAILARELSGRSYPWIGISGRNIPPGAARAEINAGPAPATMANKIAIRPKTRRAE